MKTLLCVAPGVVLLPKELSAGLHDWDVHMAGSLADARRQLDAGSYPVGLLLAGGAGALSPADEALEALLRRHWRLQWIALLSAEEAAQAAWRRLVSEYCRDFHTLPGELSRLRHTLGHAHGMAMLRAAPATAALRAGAAAASPAPAAPATCALTGQSAAIVTLRRQIAKVAGAAAPVLIWGESGSGKELVAKAIHAQSARCHGPFVPVNCGAISATLIQSELFGHEKGAFTGAARAKKGLIEAAQGGSIFLDEIADLPLELQANLLRFLQEKTIYRLGATQSVSVDVRVIAASHVKLQEAVARGAFREDLYYRLNVLALDVPPLRQRREDLADLAEHFFQQFASERAPGVRGFSAAALQAIRDYDWPGNVRELINRVRRAMVMAEGRLVMPQDLGLESGRPPVLEAAALDEARIRAERDAIDASLQRAGRNISLAARDLGVSRMTLYRLLAKHGIPASSRPSQRK